MRKKSRTALAGFVASVGVLLVPASGAAQTALPLTGEVLTQPGVSPQTRPSGCTHNADGTTTYTFATQGFANGPYPGTFTANVTVTVGPQTGSRTFQAGPATVTLAAGTLVRFDERFTITSPNGTVTGTKTLIASGTGLGSCHNFNNTPVTIGTPGGPLTINLTGVEKYATASLRYVATITTASGSFTDRGTSEAEFTESFTDVASQPVRRVHQFNETFQSAGIEPECDEDNDAQGDDQSCDNDGDSQ